MEKEKKFVDKDKEEKKKIFQTAHTTIGHFVWNLRLISPCSHSEMGAETLVTQATTRRVEHNNDFKISSCLEICYYYLKSIHVVFHLNHLANQTINALSSGKYLVIVAIDSCELKNYNPKQIILSQDFTDANELKRREMHKQKGLNELKKFGKKERVKIPHKKKKKAGNTKKK